MLPYIVVGKAHRHRHNPSVVQWREQREVEV